MAPTEPVGYLLDTNVFNDLASPNGNRLSLPKGQFYITHVQADELTATAASERRKKLLDLVMVIEPIKLSTETAVWGDSKWGQAKWSHSDGLYERLLDRIKELDKKEGKKSRNPFNQSRDARIAETAIRQNLVLVTSDPGPTQAVKENGGQVTTLEELISK